MGKQWLTLFFGAPKLLQMVTAAMKLKDTQSLEGKVWPTYFSSVQFSHSVVSDSLRPHELQQARPPCPSPIHVHHQSCLTLCNLMDYTIHGILQARILEWVAYLFSSRSSWPRNQTRLSCIAGGFFTNWGGFFPPCNCVTPDLETYLWGQNRGTYITKTKYPCSSNFKPFNA